MEICSELNGSYVRTSKKSSQTSKKFYSNFWDVCFWTLACSSLGTSKHFFRNSGKCIPPRTLEKLLRTREMCSWKFLPNCREVSRISGRTLLRTSGKSSLNIQGHLPLIREVSFELQGNLLISKKSGKLPSNLREVLLKIQELSLWTSRMFVRTNIERAFLFSEVQSKSKLWNDLSIWRFFQIYLEEFPPKLEGSSSRHSGEVLTNLREVSLNFRKVSTELQGSFLELLGVFPKVRESPSFASGKCTQFYKSSLWASGKVPLNFRVVLPNLRSRSSQSFRKVLQKFQRKIFPKNRSQDFIRCFGHIP